MPTWDQGMELNVSVLDRTLSMKGNKRGDWMKQWLTIQNFTALNTMYRKTPEKQATCKTPRGIEKQVGLHFGGQEINIFCSRDAEANDMIHMGSDHRSVMAQFVIAASQKEVSQKKHTATKRRFNTEREHKRAKMTTKRDLVKQSSSKNAMPNSKEKPNTKLKLKPPHRCKK